LCRLVGCLVSLSSETVVSGAVVSHRQRDHRIDVFRGLALIFILWDHIPNNILGLVTMRAFGLSDAAEVFVFLSGFSAALAYSAGLHRHGYLFAAVRILRRVARLYMAHIFVFAVLVGIVFVMNAHVETRDFISEMGLGRLINDTEGALVAELTLRFKPSLMDPLPLYMVLLLIMAAVLPLLVYRPRLTLALSLAVYAAAQVWDINLRAWPDGGWFFNPWAWQALFIIGAVCALLQIGPARLEARPRLRAVVDRLAWGYLLLCFALVLLWHVPAWHDRVVPLWLGQMIYPISKTALAPLRLLHFLAVAYCIAGLFRPGVWMESWCARACRVMGRHSLEVFCLGILLSPLADGVNAVLDDQPLVQVATSLTASLLMVAFAVVLEWSGALQRRGVLAVAKG